MLEIKEVWIEYENISDKPTDFADTNTDVTVSFSDGRRFAATFITYKNISSLSKKNNGTGELLSGRYFVGSYMILIENCKRDLIESVINDLIENKEFYKYFEQLEN